MRSSANRPMSRQLSLKYRVFFWIVFAVAIPMLILVGTAVKHGKNVYADEVDQEIFEALDRSVAAVDRRLFTEHDLIRALGRVPQVTDLLPALYTLKSGGEDTDISPDLTRVASFFETFQRVRSSLGTVRILDYEGDTLIKVREGQRIEPSYQNLSGMPVVENGSETAAYLSEVHALRGTDVGSLPSPPGFDALNSMLNTALPLSYNDETVGYLLIGPPLEPMDRTLDVAPRPRASSLLIAEVNPDDAGRNGLVLYSDDPKTIFSSVNVRELLSNIEPKLLDESGSPVSSKFTDRSGRSWYFREYFPYPDRLVTWIFAYHLANASIGSPFLYAGYVLWGAGLLALIVGVLFAHFAARQVSQPVEQLAHHLADYAQGARSMRLQPSGAPELQEAQASFNSMADALEVAEADREQAQKMIIQNAKLTSVGQLAAGIAHELRNPLANIFSLLKLIRRRVSTDDEQLLADINGVQGEAERASHIITGLLEYSRLGSTHWNQFSLADLVTDAVDLVGRMAERNKIVLNMGALPAISMWGDFNLLQQVLVNVLMNAIQATPASGRVDIATVAEDGWVEITVSDQGPGLSDEVAERVFDPFFTTKPEGTGLGLSIAIGIVERHRGRLSLEGKPSGGAVACIRLPIEGDAAARQSGETQ